MREPPEDAASPGRGPWSRRALLAGAGAAALAGFSGRLGIPARAASSLRYMCWPGYDDPAVLEPFERAHGADIAVDAIIDSAGGFAKLATGGHRGLDLVSMDSPWIARMGPAGLCDYLAESDVAEARAGFYEVFQAPFAPLRHGNRIVGLPTRWGWVGPSINTAFEKPETWTSYAPCFDRAYRDRICVMDWGEWPLVPMALHAGIDPYAPLATGALVELRRVLRALFKNTRAIVGDITRAQKGLLDGSFRTLVGCGTYCTSALRKAGHETVHTVVPDARNGLRQGVVWAEATAVVKGTPQAALARRFVRHLARPEIAATLAWTTATCNLVPVRAAEDLFSPWQKRALQMDAMWHAWDNSHLHEAIPDLDAMLRVYQQERARA